MSKLQFIGSTTLNTDASLIHFAVKKYLFAIIIISFFIIGCGGTSTQTELEASAPTSASSEFVPESDTSSHVCSNCPGMTIGDPEGLYDPPTEITAATIPAGAHFRFSKADVVKTVLRSKGDMIANQSTTGWFAYGKSESGMGGLQELGQLSEPVDQIEAPESGYILDAKVELKIGYTYAVKSRDDEPGHYIILRVKEFGEEDPRTGKGSLTFEYFYR